MPTRIANIYDEIVNVIEATLTDYKRLPDPYRIEKNTYLQLTKGYGVKIDSGSDTRRYMACIVTWERIFTIRLIRKITTTENNIGSKEVLEKDILSDVDLLKKAFYLNTSLNEQVSDATVISDGGIDYSSTVTPKFLEIDVNLRIEYQEDPREL